MGYGDFGSSLRDLPRLRTSGRGRASSWDRSGGNRDWVDVEPGETITLASIEGAGAVNHIWMTFDRGPHFAEDEDRDFLRKLVLRMWWDGEPEPSVAVPVGDFFGAIAPQPAQYVSLPLQVGPDSARALSSWWHMPFESSARMELTSEAGQGRTGIYYYVDYERFDALEAGLGRFHACWRRENPCDGVPQGDESNLEFLVEGENTSAAGNYVVLEAEGHGHYVGCIVAIHNLRETNAWNWYGEGDDMIFVDGEGWPPTLHGTGTEDYFDTAYCPREPFSAPYHGLIHAGSENWGGLATHYRFHIEDPIPFQHSIAVTIEHGHANKRSDDWSSVAFWYQAEPHKPFSLAPVSDRVPRAR
jgi:D-arabinan exo alpha-(1,3)/(1,5)-arabinofuranosidase (non-reducing end)